MMSHLLAIATEIQGWLAAHQIKEQSVPSEVRDGKVLLSFDHPVRGRIDVQEKLTGNDLFRSRGVVFQKDLSGSNGSVQVYDYGGIWDPVDQRVMGEHYSTSHFAYLTALLFSELQEDAYLDQLRPAIEFHAHTSPDEYAFSEWMYHWDFQNYAMLGCFSLMKNILDGTTLTTLRNSVLNGQTNARNKLCNWGAMRALAFIMRRDLFGGPLDYLHYRWNMRTVLKGEQANGCFDDDPDISRPIQYHAFTVALLHRIFLATGDQKLAEKVIAGADFLNQFIDPDGDFNYWGRGQEQIFGYGAAIYVMSAAAKLTGKKTYANQAHRLFDFLMTCHRDGHFPLVLNSHGDEERFGWYDYHHTTVYNAFLGVWLALSHKVLNEAQKLVSIALASAADNGNPSFAFLRNEDVFVALGDGLSHYASEPGLSPAHLWCRNAGWIFSCPGGPTPETFGTFFPEENITMNFLAPLAIDTSGQIYSPAHRTGVIVEATGSHIECTLDYGGFTVDRSIALQPGGIEFNDTITFTKKGVYKEFRFCNFPVVVDKFTVEVTDDERYLSCGAARVKVSCTIEDQPLEFVRLETIKTAKGLAAILAKCLLTREFEAGAEFHVRTTFETAAAGVKTGNRGEVAEHAA